MAGVEVTIPSMLATLVSSDRRLVVEADDLADVVSAVFERHPELRVHLLDEGGALRPHVSLFHNDVAVRALTGPVTDGDSVTVLQAVSGGALAQQAVPFALAVFFGTCCWVREPAPRASNAQA